MKCMLLSTKCNNGGVYLYVSNDDDDGDTMKAPVSCTISLPSLNDWLNQCC